MRQDGDLVVTDGRPVYLRWWFLLILALGPVAYIGVVGVDTVRALANRNPEKTRHKQMRGAGQRQLQLASQAVKANDLSGAADAIERAPFTAVEGVIGQNPRGLRREAWLGELEKAGFAREGATGWRPYCPLVSRPVMPVLCRRIRG